ncbi:MAG: succinate dehydrogenase/fumarate reductase iron-sulfur subunit [Gammaproteobacteria bacterium]|nr:succinate dehydrogenase/fumarate reductase iron-sulfur subunit [Gammaproteobacteria bacterium]
MSDSSTASITVHVWRGNSEGGSFDEFQVPQQPSQTILDVVTWIQRNLDAGLSYRFACRVGMCGSCAMMVNGIPRWTCRTHVNKVMRDKQLTIEPLRNLPVIKDLACDMGEFFAKWNQAQGQFQGSATRDEKIAPISPRSPEREAANAAIECINCAICYASCDVVAWNRDYLGPAALNRAWSLQNDVRDTAGKSRLAAVAGDAGCHQCHSQQGCASYCPNELNPTASIAGLKRLTASDFLRRRYRSRHA